MSLTNLTLDSVPSFLPKTLFSSKSKNGELPVGVPLEDEENRLIDPVETLPDVTSAGAFADEIERAMRQESFRQVSDAVLTVKASEVHALVREAAKAKGRYLAALIEMSRKAQSNHAAQVELRKLRLHCEELTLGVEKLRQMILDREIDIDGIA